MALALRAGFAVRAASGAVRQRKLPAQSAEALQFLLMGIATLNPSYLLLSSSENRKSL
jgi:hypothetical protein